jgi:hypothetical protein
MTCPGSPQLKNIRFKSTSVMVLSIGDMSRVLVRWELEPSSQNLSPLKFYVDRSVSPNEFEQLNAVGISAYGLHELVDYSALITDLHKIYYYRVRAVEETPEGLALQTFTSGLNTWDGDLDLVSLYIVEEHLFAHRWVYGIPAMVFKKKTDTEYCPNCWDRVLKRVTRTTCTVCYGTGKLGGYFPPIEVWMSLEPDPKAEEVTELKLKQHSRTQAQFTNYPLLTPDDLIVELKPNRYWKVQVVTYTEKNRTIVLQFPQLSAVNLTDIEYTVPVPEDRRRIMVSQHEAREKEREF